MAKIVLGIGASHSTLMNTHWEETTHKAEAERFRDALYLSREKIAASVACHAAIKINTPLEQRKMEWLLRELAATRLPMSCPHGRPVVLKYDMREILKAFHRI